MHSEEEPFVDSEIEVIGNRRKLWREKQGKPIVLIKAITLTEVIPSSENYPFQ